MTHEELRKRAVRWLTVTKHCTVVLSEIVSVVSQIPDAIGWQCDRSILVECKASRSDLLRDKDKIHHRSDSTMGGKRYYLVPPHVATVADLPEGWGLLEAREDYVKLILESEAFTPSDRAMSSEVALLVSALRRVKQREFLVIVPEELSVDRVNINDWPQS